MSEAVHTSYSRGVWAEEQAVKYLCSRGYKILERRYKTRYGEIDLIARPMRQKDVLVFVEVKLRAKLEDSLYAITPRNRRRIEQSALYYMSENPDMQMFSMRFDVLAFGEDGCGKSGGISVQHLDNAWEAGA